MTETTPRPLDNIITIDDDPIRNHIARVLRGSVETLTALLDAEADRLCNAQLRTPRGPSDTRAGQTKTGDNRQLIEPTYVFVEAPRVCRRPFRLSHAAMAGCSSMA